MHRDTTFRTPSTGPDSILRKQSPPSLREKPQRSVPPPDDRATRWYKDAIIYELHVRAFLDSTADGIGDFRGLCQRLDYLQNLGVTAIWLLPFYPSPLRDDGYDIADYYSINPIYGTLADFKKFLSESHRRGLKVITELVVNHTSDQHPWFQKSRKAPPRSKWRNFYVWSDTPSLYREARIIFRDFEPSNWTWDPVANAYFWHRFYSHQPDLNFDNPAVHQEITKVLDFWFDMGVDGLRLDAVPYLYERDGTSCENLPETHAFLKSLRKHVDDKYGDKMLLAEANQWPEDAVTYLGETSGDECHMAFHFPLMPRLFMAVRMEDRVPIVDILEQTPAAPETGQWAIFLRNHDELTLEMVTDEERDYMYRVYAHDAKARINLGIRRRLAPLLGNDRKRLELLHMLLFSLPGTPVLYYGDEIGMGDNIFLGDRNGVRTPMQWSSDKNAGFSRASPQALYLPIILDPEYHYEAVNVEAQERNPHSLLWWVKRAISLRKRHQAFGRGTLEMVVSDNRKVLSFIRRYGDEVILVVANLSRYLQPVALELRQVKNMVPVELFGLNRFSVITDSPYQLTVSPHTAFWFSLEPADRAQLDPVARCTESVRCGSGWEHLFEKTSPSPIEGCIVGYLRGLHARHVTPVSIKSVQLRDRFRLSCGSWAVFLMALTVDFAGGGEPDEYMLPIAFASLREREAIESASPQSVISKVQFDDARPEGILFDASQDPRFHVALLELVIRRRNLSGQNGELRAMSHSRFRGPVDVSLMRGVAEVSLSATESLLDSSIFMKVFRRVQPGLNPATEMGRFLNVRKLPSVPQVYGEAVYHRDQQDMTVASLRAYLPDAQSAYGYTFDMLGRFFDRVRTTVPELRLNPEVKDDILELSQRVLPEGVITMLGTYAELGRLLAESVGQLHIALSSDPSQPCFAPEPFTPFYQRALFQSLRNQFITSIQSLRANLDGLPAECRLLSEAISSGESHLMKKLKRIHEVKLPAMRIRCHGDLQLDNVLYTGINFAFLNFGGDPARNPGEQRIKRSVMHDIVTMLRSFAFVASAALNREIAQGRVPEGALNEHRVWSQFWVKWVSALFLGYYQKTIESSGLLPTDHHQLKALLEAKMLGRLSHELRWRISHKPHLVADSLSAMLSLIETR